MVNVIFLVQTTELELTCSALRAQFANEKVFIDSLPELDRGKRFEAQKRAQYKIKGYMIDDGRLCDD